VMWRDAPKLTVGQKAVLFLQQEAPEAAEVGVRGPAVLHALDVQPADTAELVAELV
jgi:hypothetical protein